MTEEQVRALERIFLELMSAETVPVRERSRVNCVQWDSLVQVALVTSIEQEFSITLSDEDALDLNSFDAAMQILIEKISSTGK